MEKRLTTTVFYSAAALQPRNAALTRVLDGMEQERVAAKSMNQLYLNLSAAKNAENAAGGGETEP